MQSEYVAQKKRTGSGPANSSERKAQELNLTCAGNGVQDIDPRFEDPKPPLLLALILCPCRCCRVPTVISDPLHLIERVTCSYRGKDVLYG